MNNFWSSGNLKPFSEPNQNLSPLLCQFLLLLLFLSLFCSQFMYLQLSKLYLHHISPQTLFLMLLPNYPKIVQPKIPLNITAILPDFSFIEHFLPWML